MSNGYDRRRRPRCVVVAVVLSNVEYCRSEGATKYEGGYTCHLVIFRVSPIILSALLFWGGGWLAGSRFFECACSRGREERGRRRVTDHHPRFFGSCEDEEGREKIKN